jgi:hypothetical protein
MKRPLYIKKHSLVTPARTPEWQDCVPASIKRRDARIWQLAYAAASQVITDGTVRPQSVVAGTALGALEETRLFLDGVFTDGLGSPRNFIASVHNSIAGKIALEFKISGPNLTLCDSHNSLASSLVATELLKEKDLPVICCIVDERPALLDELQPYLSRRCQPYLIEKWEEGAAAFIIDDHPETGSIAVRAFGPYPTERLDPETICRQLIDRYIPGFSGKFIFRESTTSFMRPTVTVCETLDRFKEHTVVGSYSPTTGAASIVELYQTP